MQEAIKHRQRTMKLMRHICVCDGFSLQYSISSQSFNSMHTCLLSGYKHGNHTNISGKLADYIVSGGFSKRITQPCANRSLSRGA